MNKPEPMTDAEIAIIFSAHSMALLPHRKKAAADLIAARDAQWEQMLAGQERVSDAAKTKLLQIHDALCTDIGDTDPDVPEGMDDDELRDYNPVFWAAKEIAALIGHGDWGKYYAAPQPAQEPNYTALLEQALAVLEKYSLPLDMDNIALSCIEYGSEAVERELQRRAAIAAIKEALK
jgi:secreted protein with Ig-like and vWFA domain